MIKNLECTFTDGHSTYKITFSSFLKSRCLHKMFYHIRDIQVTCLSAKFI